MVGLLGITLTLGANLYGLNCLGARHIAYFTFVYLICAKVQIVDNFPRISSLEMILTLMWCHPSSDMLIFKNQCAYLLQVLYACMHKHRGRLFYKLDALRLTSFQAYHVCSSLIARKMESSEISIMLQKSTTISSGIINFKWCQSNWFLHVVFLIDIIVLTSILYLYAFSMHYID
jgi:hypothetical protein